MSYVFLVAAIFKAIQMIGQTDGYKNDGKTNRKLAKIDREAERWIYR
jgi:hypothetical protein